MAINFTGEEKIDLLLKKVAYGVAKTGTSEATGPGGESITSFKAIKPAHIWKDATGSNIPSTPDAGSTSYVGVYEVDGSDSDFDTAGNVQAPVQATAVASSAQMPGFTNFKRAWDTGETNWIGPAFGSDYAVRVYVGASGWDGADSTKAASSITEVVFGDNAAADWFFDYEAGVLYWTNEEGADSGINGDYDDSVNFVNTGSVIANGEVVYVTGRQYIGATGVGTDEAANVGVTEDASGNTDYNLVFTDSTATDTSASLYINNGDISWNPSTETLSVASLALADGSITDSSGSISFGDENLSTTGTLAAGVATLSTGSAIGNLTLADGSITDSSGSISFGDENLSTTGTLSAGVATLSTGSTIGNLTLADGSITDSSGAISFGNENLSTTGTLSAGVATLSTGSTIGNLTLADGSITDSSGSISFGNENLSTTGTLSAGVATLSTGSTIGNLTLADGSITDSSGSISFGNENLSTTGTLSAGVATLSTGSTIGNLTLADGSITDSSGSISFGDENLSTTGTLSAGVATLSTGSTIGNLTLADGSITDSSGAISFGDENLSTTGTLSAGVATLSTGSTIGNLTLADGSITDSSGAISFGNENLSTTGTLSAGVATLSTGSTIGNLTLADGSITDSSGSISFGDENLSTTGNLTVGGDLTVQGDFIQETSTNVIFEDTFLDLNVPDTATVDITTDSGFRFGTAASTASILNKHAQMMYDATADVFKFTREADAGDFSAAQAKSGADNVAALKFTKTDTNTQVDQADGTTTMNAAHEANAEAVRSLGAVSKCTIEITTDADDDGDNYAPAEAGAVGYPIKHNLNTQSVFVVAIKTHDDAGSALADPVPVYCKYIPEDSDTIRVSVGVTKRLEKYDIIVIG